METHTIQVDNIFGKELIHGCDSNVYLNLTINQESYKEVSISTCSTYFWNGTTYDQSGIYYDTLTNIYGCDSVVKLSLNVSNYSI